MLKEVCGSWELPFAEVAWGAPGATSSVAASWTAGEHPLWVLRSWVSPPVVDHDRWDSNARAPCRTTVDTRLFSRAQG
ncbi:hypothetical protein AERO9AM_30118 [Aeromicrobium sp. 9AM]|nr:hypothetical protein AERO9AM_30118 [Aeromicrobium sp. 9AM]